MKIIDINKPISIRIKGFSNGAWAELVTAPASIDLEDIPDKEVYEELDKALDQFNNIINQAYKDENSGYMQLGNTSISILRFDAIQIGYAQGGEDVILEDDSKDWVD